MEKKNNRFAVRRMDASFTDVHFYIVVDVELYHNDKCSIYTKKVWNNKVEERREYAQVENLEESASFIFHEKIKEISADVFGDRMYIHNKYIL